MRTFLGKTSVGELSQSGFPGFHRRPFLVRISIRLMYYVLLAAWVPSRETARTRARAETKRNSGDGLRFVLALALDIRASQASGPGQKKVGPEARQNSTFTNLTFDAPFLVDFHCSDACNALLYGLSSDFSSANGSRPPAESSRTPMRPRLPT